MKRYAHALVVGGSGMFAGLCRELLKVSEKVSVLARDEKRVAAISPSLIPMLCDYHDLPDLTAALDRLAASHGAPDLMIVWMHGKVLPQRLLLAQSLSAGGTFLQVLATDEGLERTDHPPDELKSAAAGLPLFYQSVVLGFILEGNGSRWLTKAEISDGVWRALLDGKPHGIVGTNDPMSMRPD